MKIATIGRGNVGGGLADRWERAGHDVTRLGRDGGDVSDADVVLVSVPSGEVGNALSTVAGVEGKRVIDTTNTFQGGPPDGIGSLVEWVKSITKGPVAKCFNVNLATLYGQIDEQRVRPSQLWAGDDEIQEVTEQLVRDAGYEPVRVGGFDQAPALEQQIAFYFAITQAGLGPCFYRYAPPGEL
jgi:predicted dinucleotide-binding enzyme